MPCFGSHADTAPAWFDDFANGLLSAQKLAAALIVLHTGEGSWEGAGGGPPGNRPQAVACLMLPSDPVFSSLHFHHSRASYQAPLEKEPPDEPLVVPDGARSVSVVAGGAEAARRGCALRVGSGPEAEGRLLERPLC